MQKKKMSPASDRIPSIGASFSFSRDPWLAFVSLLTTTQNNAPLTLPPPANDQDDISQLSYEIGLLNTDDF
jgi:outer membrane protein TolC